MKYTTLELKIKKKVKSDKKRKERNISAFMESKYPLDKIQVDFFKQRQRKHEDRVKKNVLRILRNPKYKYLEDKLIEESNKHDESKWSKEEYFAYVWLTSVYNLDYEYPSKELEEYVNETWKNHYKVNKHHPEYYISKYNDISKMTVLDLAHMVADWASMSQEFNSSLLDWYNTNASKKYDFTSKQRKIIEDLMSVFPEVL